MQHPYAHIPELAQSSNSIGVLRIPVEQDVPFTPRVRALVDTPSSSDSGTSLNWRLASRVYPGATHTRFEHALGVYPQCPALPLAAGSRSRVRVHCLRA
ncbi:MAG UNVERIFIED_CONTAM: hypothetical protein LVR18_28860 [Planctomycetaceae bacterium]